MKFDDPLPDKLPGMRPERMEMLIRWAHLQLCTVNDHEEFLLARTSAYECKFPAPPLVDPLGFTDEGEGAQQLHRTHCQAAAALDLLKHVTNCTDNRQAVEALDEKLDGFNEAIKDWKPL